MHTFLASVVKNRKASLPLSRPTREYFMPPRCGDARDRGTDSDAAREGNGLDCRVRDERLAHTRVRAVEDV